MLLVSLGTIERIHNHHFKNQCLQLLGRITINNGGGIINSASPALHVSSPPLTTFHNLCFNLGNSNLLQSLFLKIMQLCCNNRITLLSL